MINHIPKALITQLKKDHEDILKFLISNGYYIQNLPDDNRALKDYGEAYSLAYPIQGILKYHGFTNPQDQIAYFPSISFCNDCVFTITYLKFDKSLKKDSAFLNGEQVFMEVLNRIKRSLNFLRKYSNIKTKAILISRNFLNSPDLNEVGKGLGTSASGSAALSLAAASVIYDNNHEYITNKRLISIFSRYLSGSGCRSAMGGISLWLSHPKIDPYDSYAIRLDNKRHQKLIENISLITIPIKSDLKTNQAHKSAPLSPFFLPWLKNRKTLILEFFGAFDNNDFNTIGEIAEYDTLCLHSVAMTPRNNQLIAWTPDTLRIMHKVREMREEHGYNVYFSIDTGPSVVVLTRNHEKDKVFDELKSIIPEHIIIKGKIGGPSEILDPNSQEAKKLDKDIEKFKVF